MLDCVCSGPGDYTGERGEGGAKAKNRRENAVNIVSEVPDHVRMR